MGTPVVTSLSYFEGTTMASVPADVKTQVSSFWHPVTPTTSEHRLGPAFSWRCPARSLKNIVFPGSARGLLELQEHVGCVSKHTAGVSFT